MDAAGLKVRVAERVDARADALDRLALEIHARPELAYEERFAADALASYLSREGADVRRSAGGLETAFVAEAGSGRPVVAILGEYDALPGVGHACGHNLMGTAAAGAFLALRDVAGDVKGRVRVVGCPAEERGNGKVALIKAGVFADVDAALLMVRSPDNAYLGALRQRVLACFEGAALATGCELRYEWSDVCEVVRTTRPLAEAFSANAGSLGRSLQPRRPADTHGSTDMGNVSTVVPGIHPFLAITPGPVPGHSIEFAAAAATPRALETMRVAAKALAMTALDVDGPAVVGLDRSSAMLARAERRARALGADVRWVEGDMRNFSFDGTFALITVPANTFLMLAPDERWQCLARSREHLAPDGRLAIDVFQPDPARIAGLDGGVVRDWTREDPESGREVAKFSSVQANVDGTTFRWWYEEVDPGGAVRRWEREATLHYLYRREAELLFPEAGFEIESMHGDYDGSSTGPRSPKLLIVAKRRERGAGRERRRE